MAETYIEKLTTFALGLKSGDIPADVREAVGYFLLDAIGVAIANREKPFVLLQANVVKASTKSGKSTFIGHEETFVAEGAAQLNSATIHGSDFDATHLPSIMHTSAVILPAALAVAEEVDASGAELTAAVVGGSEILIRMGLATMGAMHRLGFQSTAVSTACLRSRSSARPASRQALARACAPSPTTAPGASASSPAGRAAPA
jgi:2-methylcitrate dehydratase PrpD